MEEQKIWGSLHPFIEGGDVLGRGVANEGFLSALLQEASFAAYHFYLPDQAQINHVSAALRRLFPDEWKCGALVVRNRRELPAALAQTRYHCFHLSDCIADSMPLMRLRNAYSSHIFPVTGVTHSLSYARYAPYFFSQMWQGCTRRDVIVCTSRAGQQAVASLFSSQRKAYTLTEADFPAPRLEHIPLGIRPEQFPTPEERTPLGAVARCRLGVTDDTLVLLAFARISLYSKMDIMPLLHALKRAESMGLASGNYVLVLAGWVDGNDTVADVYSSMAERMGIRLVVMPSPSNKERKGLFAAADMFLSPVDNMQETFGLTMLEAGASGLPVVASDFDGYRDLIVHGETGFLVPTIGPSSTGTIDALSTLWFDSDYHLQLAQESVVRVPELAAHIATLAADPALRRRMGDAARAHVLAQYTWKQVIAQYVTLWDELAQADIDTAMPTQEHPLYPGFAKVFGGYYSRLLGADNLAASTVCLTATGEAVYRQREVPLVYAGIDHLIDNDALRRMLFIARKPLHALQFLAQAGVAATMEGEKAAYLVLWALKHDLLELVDTKADA